MEKCRDYYHGPNTDDLVWIMTFLPQREPRPRRTLLLCTSLQVSRTEGLVPSYFENEQLGRPVRHLARTGRPHDSHSVPPLLSDSPIFTRFMFFVEFYPERIDGNNQTKTRRQPSKSRRNNLWTYTVILKVSLGNISIIDFFFLFDMTTTTPVLSYDRGRKGRSN